MTLPLAAFLDASVLYPANIRNLLMRLSINGAFRPLWSEAVHEEWTRAVLRDRPHLTPTQIARTRALMEAHASDAMVTGYEPLIDGLLLPDPNDRHVLAAAITGGAAVIVTANIRDFPAVAMQSHGLEAIHPDAFIARLLIREPEKVLSAAEEHRASLRSPPQTVAVYLAALRHSGLTQTADALTSFAGWQ
jgi:predicted nucleic acid-binding protein